MTHHHHGLPTHRSSALWLAVTLNLAIIIGELIGGFLAGSLALIADAFHNVTDMSALVLVLVARRLGSRPPSAHHTFGFRRAEVMAGILNGLLLFAAMGFIGSRAIERLMEPRAVGSTLMMALGAVALVINAFAAWLLHRDPVQDLGVRSAVLHLLTDAGASGVVVVGGLIVRTTGWYRVDPVLSLIIAAGAMWGAFRLIREGVHILMEGTPGGLSPTRVVETIARTPGVDDVQHVHLWSIASTEPSLTATLIVADQPLSDAQAIIRDVERRLARRFDIQHTVLQIEVEPREPPGCGIETPSTPVDSRY